MQFSVAFFISEYKVNTRFATISYNYLLFDNHCLVVPVMQRQP